MAETDKSSGREASSAGGLLSAKFKQGVKPASAAKSKPAARKNVKKRWFMMMAAAAVVMFALASMMSTKPKPPVNQDANQPILSTTPKGLSQESWQAQSQATLKSQQTQLEQLQSELAALKKQQADSAKAAAAAAAKPVTLPPAPPPNGLFGGQSVVPPPPPLPMTRNSASVPVPGQNALAPITHLPTGAQQPQESESDNSSSPTVFAAPKTNDSGQPQANASESYQKNSYAGYLPTGSFVPVALLNGVDAGTGATTQSNPQPVLLRLQDNAVLPGAARYQLKSCFVLASAYGDLSSERVYMRLATLSCVDKHSGLVLSSPVEGYVVDSDGKLGLRGKVIDRQGALLGKSLLAGFAQGLSNALGAGQGVSTFSSLTGASTSFTGSQAFREAGLSGAGTAASQLAQFYLKEAEALFPVISINTGRTGTIVFSKGVSLQWHEAKDLYVKQIKPKAGAQ